MFSKPPHKTKQSLLKHSEAKKLRGNLESEWYGTDDILLNQLGFFHQLRQISYSRDISVIIDDENQLPLCFTVPVNRLQSSNARENFKPSSDVKYIPSLYVLQKAPHIIKRSIRIHKGLAKKLYQGSAFFMPGVWTTPLMFDPSSDWVMNVFGFDFKKSDLVSLREYPPSGDPICAIGVFKLSAEELRESTGLQGKGIDLVHVETDWLWSLGPKTRPPRLVHSSASESQPLHDDASESVKDEATESAVGERTENAVGERTENAIDDAVVGLVDDSSDIPEDTVNDKELPLTAISQDALKRLAAAQMEQDLKNLQENTKKKYEEAQLEIIELNKRRRNREKTLRSCITLKKSSTDKDFTKDQLEKIDRIPSLEDEITEIERRIQELHMLKPEIDVESLIAANAGSESQQADQASNMDSHSDQTRNDVQTEESSRETQETRGKDSAEGETIDQDELTRVAFMLALRNVIDSKEKLPLILSAFSGKYLKTLVSSFRLFQSDSWQLDWKATSWKKLLTFLETDALATSIVSIALVSEGVNAISEINTEKLNAFIETLDIDELIIEDGSKEGMQSELITGKIKKKNKDKVKVTLSFETKSNKKRTCIHGVIDNWSADEVKALSKTIKQKFACQVTMQDNFVIVGGHHLDLDEVLQKELNLRQDQLIHKGKAEAKKKKGK